MALASNDEAQFSDLYVFSDGSKTQNDYAAVAEVRNVSRSITGFRTVSLITREQNSGCHSRLLMVSQGYVVNAAELSY